MKNSPRCRLLFIVVACVVWAAWNSPAFADEDIDIASQQSATDTNYAQDQHAINVADTATLKDPRVASLKEYLGHTEDALQRANESQDEDKIEDARAAYESAREQFDTAFAETYAEKRAEIDALRSNGLGWGEIAHKMGVHPGVLGLGHTKHQDRYEKNYQASTQQGVQTQRGSPGSANAHKGHHSGYGQAKDPGSKSSSQGGGHGGGHGGGKK